MKSGSGGTENVVLGRGGCLGGSLLLVSPCRVVVAVVVVVVVVFGAWSFVLLFAS